MSDLRILRGADARGAAAEWRFIMAKAGMRRPDVTQPHGTEGWQRLHVQKNDAPPVPEIQGKAKAGHEKAREYHVPNHEPK